MRKREVVALIWLCCCWCSVALPRDAVDLSVACDWDISWSCSLARFSPNLIVFDIECSVTLLHELERLVLQTQTHVNVITSMVKNICLLKVVYVGWFPDRLVSNQIWCRRSIESGHSIAHTHFYKSDICFGYACLSRKTPVSISLTWPRMAWLVNKALHEPRRMRRNLISGLPTRNWRFGNKCLFQLRPLWQ